MIGLAVALGAAFAIAGWLGTRIAENICAARVPLAGAPDPVEAPAWPFAALAALVGVAVGLSGDAAPQIAMLWLLALALSGIASADLRRGIVPDVLSVPPLLALVAGALLRHDPGPAAGALIVAFPFALAALVSHGRGMGWGDVKLAALGGAVLGAHDATFALFAGCVAAYALAMVRRRVAQPSPLAPYLVAAFALAVVIDPVR